MAKTKSETVEVVAEEAVEAKKAPKGVARLRGRGRYRR